MASKRAYGGNVLEYRCEWCGRGRNGRQGWILGLAGERVGAAQSRREVVILDTWSERTASDPLAVCFCCADHRNRYLKEFFSRSAAPVRQRLLTGGLRMASQTVSSGRRRTSVGALAIGSPTRHSTAKLRDSLPKRRSRRRARPAAAFTSEDVVRAHGMGIALGEVPAAKEKARR
jgi:hypothetical protein